MSGADLVSVGLCARCDRAIVVTARPAGAHAPLMRTPKDGAYLVHLCGDCLGVARTRLVEHVVSPCGPYPEVEIDEDDVEPSEIRAADPVEGE